MCPGVDGLAVGDKDYFNLFVFHLVRLRSTPVLPPLASSFRFCLAGTSGIKRMLERYAVVPDAFNGHGDIPAHIPLSRD